MSEISASSPVKAAPMPRPRRRSRRAALPSRPVLAGLQLGSLVVLFGLWYELVKLEVLPVFFFGDPILVLQQIVDWFMSGEIFTHLVATLSETVLAFIIGVLSGVMGGLWLGLSPLAAALSDPYIKAFNAMPRVILAPIFIVWFGLGIWSKVALGVTLVFFVVFFNVFQGVREVSPVILANSRMLGANKRQLLLTVYVPSALSWVFSSLHTSVGMAFVGAVVGEYLGSARGIGYLILQAESTFDVNAVFAGILVLTVFALLLDTGVSLAEKRLIKGRATSVQ
jgi:NitT/TauT family transport system permease protein